MVSRVVTMMPIDGTTVKADGEEVSARLGQATRPLGTELPILTREEDTYCGAREPIEPRT